jgi:hypothetical protein
VSCRRCTQLTQAVDVLRSGVMDIALQYRSLFCGHVSGAAAAAAPGGGSDPILQAWFVAQIRRLVALVSA